MKASVILATYNEKENIVKLSRAIMKIMRKAKIDYEIIVVDDNSPDRTANAARKAFGKNKKIKLIIRKNERGLGTAVGRGVKEANGNVIVFMDTDFSHNPEQIPELVKLTNKYDIVNASRYEKGGGFNTKIYRKIATKIMKIYISLLLQLNINDYTNGFFAARKVIIDKLEHERIFYGYGDYYFRFFYAASKKGARIKEIPTYYKFRKEGQSKTNILNHGIQYALAAIKLRLGLY